MVELVIKKKKKIGHKLVIAETGQWVHRESLSYTLVLYVGFCLKFYE